MDDMICGKGDLGEHSEKASLGLWKLSRYKEKLFDHNR